MHIGYWWKIQKERDHWEDQDVGGWIIKMDLREIGWDRGHWIDVDQDRDQWRALVNEPSSSIDRWEDLEWLHNGQLLKKGAAP
jgi:hypothetical protein